MSDTPEQPARADEATRFKTGNKAGVGNPSTRSDRIEQKWDQFEHDALSRDNWANLREIVLNRVQAAKKQTAEANRIEQRVHRRAEAVRLSKLEKKVALLVKKLEAMQP